MHLSHKASMETCCQLREHYMKALIVQVHRATGHDGKQLAVKVISAAVCYSMRMTQNAHVCPGRYSTERFSLIASLATW